MKVKAINKYHDTALKRDIKVGDEFEVDSEERLAELLGNNKCICQVKNGPLFQSKKLVSFTIFSRDCFLISMADIS